MKHINVLAHVWVIIAPLLKLFPSALRCHRPGTWHSAKVRALITRLVCQAQASACCRQRPSRKSTALQPRDWCLLPSAHGQQSGTHIRIGDAAPQHGRTARGLVTSCREFGPQSPVVPVQHVGTTSQVLCSIGGSRRPPTSLLFFEELISVMLDERDHEFPRSTVHASCATGLERDNISRAKRVAKGTPFKHIYIMTWFCRGFSCACREISTTCTAFAWNLDFRRPSSGSAFVLLFSAGDFSLAPELRDTIVHLGTRNTAIFN
jgi:hypothetical protein